MYLLATVHASCNAKATKINGIAMMSSWMTDVVML